MAAKIVAAKSGKSWGETVREKILNPVGMTGTTTSLAEGAAIVNQSGPHSRINDRIALVKPVPVPNAAGAVGINSNAEDLAKWMQVLLDSGKIASKGLGADGKPVRLYSDARADDLWSAQTPMRIPATSGPLAPLKANFSAYGLGFNLRDYHGQKIALHGGALIGFYTRVILVPESKLGIAILTNAENNDALVSLQYRLLDAYMTGAKSPVATDWIKVFGDDQAVRRAKEVARLKAASSSRAATSKPSLALAAYDGEYQDAWYGKVAIRHEGGKQVMSFARTPDLTRQLTNLSLFVIMLSILVHGFSVKPLMDRLWRKD